MQNVLVRDTLCKRNFSEGLPSCDNFLRHFGYFLHSTFDIWESDGLMHRDEMRRTTHISLLVRVGRETLWHDSSYSSGSWDLEFRIDIPGSRDLV